MILAALASFVLIVVAIGLHPHPPTPAGTCRARERLKKEMIKHAMADANSHMEVNMDITSTATHRTQIFGAATS